MVRLKLSFFVLLLLFFKNFNPTMVRLKLAISYCLLYFRKHFNPTMVRLKLADIRAGGKEQARFQSHNGSIKT